MQQISTIQKKDSDKTSMAPVSQVQQESVPDAENMVSEPGVPFFLQRFSTSPSPPTIQRYLDEEEEEKEAIIFPKLTVGEPDDEHEREANQVADMAMRAPEINGEDNFEETDDETLVHTKSSPPSVQPEMIDEEENNGIPPDSVPLQRKANERNALSPTHQVNRVIQMNREGNRIPRNVASRIGRVLGADFSHVKVHDDQEAHEAAKSIHAKAFTHKDHIYLGKNQTAGDISLMSHELAHVIQQEGSSSQQIGASDHRHKPLHNVTVPLYLRKANLLQRQSKQHIALKPLYANPYRKKTEKLFEIINITDKVVETGMPMAYWLVQTHNALLPANLSHNFSWFFEHNTDDFKKAMAINKKLSEQIPFLEALLYIPKIILGPQQSNRRLWITKTLIPGVHRLKVKVFLGENYQTTLVLIQQVTPSGISHEFEEIHQLASQIKSKTPEEFGYTDIVKWKLSNRYLTEFKEHFVNMMKNTIKKAAVMFDIPEVLLAGVAYIEVGGKDPIKRFVYDIRNKLQGKKARLKTSLGPMAVQVRRAAEALGHDPLKMNAEVEAKIVEALYNPKQAIFIAAKHLSDLRNIDFPNKSASQLTWEDIEVIGARYNQGPDKSLLQIKKDLSYGKTIRRRAKQLEYLISETTTLPAPAFEPIKEHVEEPLMYKYNQLEKSIESWYLRQMGPFY